ncbi:MAG: hypothetical protein K2J80_10090, partial [Oscillospiraceae bacterium]|nr:hypothetical protein [Oscillospiraceae bacterium]
MDIKDIFPYEKPIKLSADFNQQLDKRRMKYKADKTQVEGETVRIDIDNIKDIPDGKIRFDVDDVGFECFFHKGTSEKLYIILNGGLTRSGKNNLPRFNRWSYYLFCEHSWLSIEDPTYFDNKDVIVGWFYGTENKNYRQYVAYIAEKICGHLNISKDDVCFWGSSSGGTAAIHSAALFGGGVAVSLNGQINFEYDYRDVLEFIQYTKIDLHKADKWDRNNICKIISEAKNVKFILIENCRSRWDIDDHLMYLCNGLSCPLPEYGISQFNNITTWIYDAPAKFKNSGHVCWETKNIFYAIDFLVGLVRDNDDIQRYKPLYLLFNEFWYEIYYPAMKFRVDDKETLSVGELISKLTWNRQIKSASSSKLKK